LSSLCLTKVSAAHPAAEGHLPPSKAHSILAICSGLPINLGEKGKTIRTSKRLLLYVAANDQFEVFRMMLSLFAEYGRSDRLALAPDRERLPDSIRWSLRKQDAIDIGRLMLDQQRAIRRDGFIRGTYGN